MLGLHLCRADETSRPAEGKAGDQAGKGKPSDPAQPPAEDLKRQGKAKDKPAGRGRGRKRKGE
jgi:hypothetical protein